MSSITCAPVQLAEHKEQGQRRARQAIKRFTAPPTLRPLVSPHLPLQSQAHLRAALPEAPQLASDGAVLGDEDAVSGPQSERDWASDASGGSDKQTKKGAQQGRAMNGAVPDFAAAAAQPDAARSRPGRAAAAAGAAATAAAAADGSDTASEVGGTARAAGAMPHAPQAAAGAAPPDSSHLASAPLLQPPGQRRSKGKSSKSTTKQSGGAGGARSGGAKRPMQLAVMKDTRLAQLRSHAEEHGFLLHNEIRYIWYTRAAAVRANGNDVVTVQLRRCVFAAKSCGVPCMTSTADFVWLSSF